MYKTIARHGIANMYPANTGVYGRFSAIRGFTGDSRNKFLKYH